MKSEIGGRRGARALVVLVALAASTSCSKAGRARDPFVMGPSGGTGRIEVAVQNLNFSDLNLFAVRGGERIRVGSVTGKSDRSFELSWNFSVPLRFEAHLVGGQTCRVRELTVDPGDVLWVRIPTEVSITPCRVGKY